MKQAESETVQLTHEVRRLRLAIERTQRALMNGRDAMLYMGYSAPIFYKLVKAGVIPQTVLDDDMEARYWRVALDRVIEQHTEVQS